MQRNKILHCEKSILHLTNRNAIQELEWLKLQLAVDEEEIELMIMEAKNENIILR